MNWQLTGKVANFTSGELKVSLMLKDIVQLEWLYDAESFKREFDEKIKGIKVSRSYIQPANVFLCKVIDESKVEIWKIKSDGEYLKLFYIITKNR